MTGVADLAQLTAKILDRPAEEVRAGLDRMSFVEMGGSSLQAVRLSAESARLAADVPLHRLLGREPVGAVLRAAGPLACPAPQAPPEPASVREPLPGQTGMLQVEDFAGGSAYHLLFTAEVEGAPAEAMPAALTALTARHESLRTVFVRADPATGEVGRRVLPHARPRVIRQVLRLPAEVDPVAAVHAQLGHSSGRLLRPYEQPPACFTVTVVTQPPHPDRVLVSMLVHHALADAWSIGVLFGDLATLLAGQPLGPAPSPETVLAEHRRRSGSAAWAGQLRERAELLRGVPPVLELPSDARRPSRWEVSGSRLPGTFRPAAVDAWNRLAETTGSTTTAVLLAAYALALGRRAGVRDLMIGVPAAGRHHPSVHDVAAPCTQLVPVRCVLDDTATAAEYVSATGQALAEAVAGDGLPLERLAQAIGGAHDRRRNPLVQFVLGVHDELVPETIQRGGVGIRLHEGHCQGAAFDATLFVQRGGDTPRLALEYAHGALTAAEAADLLDATDAALTELAAGLDRPLARARTVSAAQAARLDALHDGPALPPETAGSDLWPMFLVAARAHPDAIAVRDGDIVLSYADLVKVAGAEAAALTAAGIGDGDAVLLAMPRGAAEIIAILAVLAVGAYYVAIDPATPDERLRTLLQVLPPAAIMTDAHPESTGFAARAQAACPRPVIRPDPVDPRTVPGTDRLPAARPSRGDRVAYVAFTSGSTGLPKAVRVPHRAVARLVWPGPDRVVDCRPGTRMLRLAPLAFDASTLEVFAPLAAGGCCEVYPPGLAAPAELADFLLDRQVDVLWLTAGLFRLMADFAPHCFAHTVHVLTGGDVVAPEQVRALLTRYPGLRVSNGYGPTENTTFSAVCHFDDPSEVTGPLPIGTPIPGSGVLILDQSGRAVPPGGVGELYVTGLGLALDYAGDAERTAASFLTMPETAVRAYRTGDLARLAGSGRLEFLGRTDHQVKIRGFRVELDEVRRALSDQPGIKDAVVTAIGADASARRLAAGIVPAGPAAVDLGEVAGRLGRALPGYAVPALWAVFDEIPLTRNGKVDAAALESAARPLDGPRATPRAGQRAGQRADPPEPVPEPGLDPGQPASGPSPAGLAGLAWSTVLGRPPTGPDSDFFRAGGDSLLFARMIAWLRREHDVRIPPRELYACPTPRRLAELIQPELAATGGPT